MVTYHEQMARVSLASLLKEIREQTAASQGNESQVSGDSKQMTFEFFGEMRTEDLIQFRSRTSGTAQGLRGSQRQTYIEASRKVAARFRLSLTISGEALSGFSRASENLKDGSPALLDQFLGFTNSTLTKSDDIVNEIFKLLDGYFRGGDDAEASFQKFIQALFGGAGGGGEKAAQSSDAAQLNVQMELSFEYSEETQVVQESDPIALDLNGDGIDLTSYQDGARFNITGKDPSATTAFVTGGDAFLAIDRNGNGVIDDGTELFGDQNGARNGYEELAKLDSNQDGRINRLDRDFDRLLLFKDNGNGRTENGELVSLKDAGIAELDLAYKNVKQAAAGGNRIAQVASYRRNDGSVGRTADAVLRFKA